MGVFRSNTYKKNLIKCTCWLISPLRKHFKSWHNILELCIIFESLDSPQVRQCLISSIKNIVYELDLGSQEIGDIGKMGKLGGDRAYCPIFQKQNFGSTGQKLPRSSYQSFLLLPNFAWFLYFIPNILSRIISIFFITSKSFSNF